MLLSHTCQGGYAGKPEQCLGGRCLGLVFVIPAAHLEWESLWGRQRDTVQSWFLCRWALQVCSASSGRKRGWVLQQKTEPHMGLERKEKGLSPEHWETLRAPTKLPCLTGFGLSGADRQTFLGNPLYRPPTFSYLTGAFFEMKDAHVSIPFQTKGDPFLPSGPGSAFPGAAQGEPLPPLPPPTFCCHAQKGKRIFESVRIV